MKAVLGDELPHDRSHAAMYLLGGPAGLLLAGLPLLGLGSFVGATMIGYTAFMVGAWFVQIRHLRARRAQAPALWRAGRKELGAALVLIVLLVGYVVWISNVARLQGQWGLPGQFAMASSVFYFLGAMGCAWVVMDRPRWPNLSGALALVLAGSVIPLCTTREQFHVVLGTMLLVGGVSSGLLLLWQIRRHEVAHAD
jgi:hypothetical protein